MIFRDIRFDMIIFILAEILQAQFQQIRVLLFFSCCQFSPYVTIASPCPRGWSGGAMALGKLPVPGRSTILIIVGQGPTALAAGAGGGYLDIFSLIYPISILSPSLWETARYRLKYCLKGPLNPKQPTNQPTNQPAGPRSAIGRAPDS